MKYSNIGEKEIADSLLQKLAEILPDLKIEKMELAESKQSFLRYTIYDIRYTRMVTEEIVLRYFLTSLLFVVA